MSPLLRQEPLKHTNKKRCVRVDDSKLGKKSLFSLESFRGRLLSLNRKFSGSLFNSSRFILEIKCEKQDPKL